MSSSGGNGGDQDSYDKRNKVTGGGKETVSLPVSPAVPVKQEDDRKDVNSADLKKLTLENEKLLKETTNLARKNQTLFETNAQYLLAKLHADNQRLVEEVLAQTKKNNTALAMQSELCEKILEASESVGTDCEMANSPDTKAKSGEKRLLVKEEISETEMRKVQKLNSEEEDQSSEDRRE